jgi:hypothetical protein
MNDKKLDEIIALANITKESYHYYIKGFNECWFSTYVSGQENDWVSFEMADNESDYGCEILIHNNEVQKIRYIKDGKYYEGSTCFTTDEIYYYVLDKITEFKNLIDINGIVSIRTIMSKISLLARCVYIQKSIDTELIRKYESVIESMLNDIVPEDETIMHHVKTLKRAIIIHNSQDNAIINDKISEIETMLNDKKINEIIPYWSK